MYIYIYQRKKCCSMIRTSVHKTFEYEYRVSVIMFNTTFNNISVISWQSVLLVEETGVPGVSNQPAVT